MDIETTKLAAAVRRAGLSVAVAAAIGGAVFGPAAAAQAAPHAATTATSGTVTPDGCGDCYPDVI
ncbi:hypothetical protein OIB37_17010 [Streptomyces sp. NBC_00820]|uniref:hypothetical protein n=1 Tax=Streptomyces sp. NBC_00820 TaxID=2975842 RepID=UPI002ED4BCEF|nr:hypothetical protein OIB37_17005 [Streptomyces sp. NBC_00820]WTI14696.1 hypothetical protein OIB37_17010 [Streptomyces sp. NBC_00820]